MLHSIAFFAAALATGSTAATESVLCREGTISATAGIAAYDPVALAEFYTDVLDFTLLGELKNEGRPSTYLLQCTNLMVEIIPHGSVTTEEAARARLAETGFPYGPFKFGFFVPDLEPAMARLAKADVAVMMGPVDTGDGSRFLLFRDVQGNVVQMYDRKIDTEPEIDTSHGALEHKES